MSRLIFCEYIYLNSLAEQSHAVLEKLILPLIAVVDDGFGATADGPLTFGAIDLLKGFHIEREHSGWHAE